MSKLFERISYSCMIFFIVVFLIFIERRISSDRMYCPDPAGNGSIQYTVDASVSYANSDASPPYSTLFIVDTLTEEKHFLLESTTSVFYDPVIALDGEFIIFAQTEEPYGTAAANLWQIRPDGTELRQLTAFTDPHAGPSHPAISPDKSAVAFDSYYGISILYLQTLEISPVVMSHTSTQTKDWMYFQSPTFVAGGKQLSYLVTTPHKSLQYITDDLHGKRWDITSSCK